MWILGLQGLSSTETLGVNFQHSDLAVPGLNLCVCFVGYLGKKNPMYQQETTIRQRVNVSFFYITSGS